MLDIVFDWIIYQRIPITIVIAVIIIYCLNYAFDLSKKTVDGGHAFITATLLLIFAILIWLPDAY